VLSMMMVALILQSSDTAGIDKGPDPKAMSEAEIRAFNASVPANHPFHIRCKRYLAPGSAIKKLYSCRTNEQWRAAWDAGNQEARNIGDHFQSKAGSQ
jgi:plasmid maintenance system killer protein